MYALSSYSGAWCGSASGCAGMEDDSGRRKGATLLMSSSHCNFSSDCPAVIYNVELLIFTPFILRGRFPSPRLEHNSPLAATYKTITWLHCLTYVTIYYTMLKSSFVPHSNWKHLIKRDSCSILYIYRIWTFNFFKQQSSFLFELQLLLLQLRLTIMSIHQQPENTDNHEYPSATRKYFRADIRSR